MSSPTSAWRSGSGGSSNRTTSSISLGPLHREGSAGTHSIRQRTRVCRSGRAGMDYGSWSQDRLHCPRFTLGECLHRELQCAAPRRAARWRNLLHAGRGQDRYRELEALPQHSPSPWFLGIQATSTRGLHPCTKAGGCASPTGSAARTGAETINELTSHPDHPMGADRAQKRSMN